MHNLFPLTFCTIRLHHSVYFIWQLEIIIKNVRTTHMCIRLVDNHLAIGKFTSCILFYFFFQQTMDSMKIT